MFTDDLGSGKSVDRLSLHPNTVYTSFVYISPVVQNVV